MMISAVSYAQQATYVFDPEASKLQPNINFIEVDKSMQEMSPSTLISSLLDVNPAVVLVTENLNKPGIWEKIANIAKNVKADALFDTQPIDLYSLYNHSVNFDQVYQTMLSEHEDHHSEHRLGLIDIKARMELYQHFSPQYYPANWISVRSMYAYYSLAKEVSTIATHLLQTYQPDLHRIESLNVVLPKFVAYGEKLHQAFYVSPHDYEKTSNPIMAEIINATVTQNPNQKTIYFSATK
ncbi:MAG: hypothetical protein R3A45_08385 [Bdellovibrionota bacterium]